MVSVTCRLCHVMCLLACLCVCAVGCGMCVACSSSTVCWLSPLVFVFAVVVDVVVLEWILYLYIYIYFFIIVGGKYLMVVLPLKEFRCLRSTLLLWLQEKNDTPQDEPLGNNKSFVVFENGAPVATTRMVSHFQRCGCNEKHGCASLETPLTFYDAWAIYIILLDLQSTSATPLAIYDIWAI